MVNLSAESISAKISVVSQVHPKPSRECLDDHEKAVFKTYPEIDQRAIIYQAGARQDYIDQAQSLNVIIHPDTPAKEINNLYLDAWRVGVKTLYYQHSMNAAQLLNQKQACVACEG